MEPTIRFNNPSFNITDPTDHPAAKEAYDQAQTFLRIVKTHVYNAVAGKEGGPTHEEAGKALDEALSALDGVKQHIEAEMKAASGSGGMHHG